MLAAHMLLMLSLGALITPVFTLGLGTLPPHLHPHGSSQFGTMQQVSAAIGTSAVVTVMSWRARGVAQAGEGTLDSLVDGMRWGFGFSALAAIGLLVLASRLPGRAPPHVEDPDDEPVGSEAAAEGAPS
jgi:DHA2 family lincomycin resistance protein-like MFS transporter